MKSFWLPSSLLAVVLLLMVLAWPAFAEGPSAIGPAPHSAVDAEPAPAPHLPPAPKPYLYHSTTALPFLGATAPAPAPAPAGDVDPLALFQQLLQAFHAHNYLLLVPLALLFLIFGLRKFGSKLTWANGQVAAWIASDVGGAVLSLVAAVAAAVAAAAALPGPHALAAIVSLVIATIVHNQAFFALLKKLGIDLSIVAPVLEAAPAAPPAAPPAPPVVPPVVKALLIALTLGSLLAASPARADNPAPVVAPAPVAAVSTGNSVLWSVGPTIPFLLYTPGQKHPVSILSGAGMQLSFTLPQLQVAFFGRAWDMIDLTLMAFGSLVTRNDGQQFGALSAAVALCTMSSMLCIGPFKQIMDAGQGFLPGKDGWGLLFALSFNFAGSPTAPPMGVAQGAAGLRRGNTLYFGGL